MEFATHKIMINELRQPSESGCTIFRIPANVCRGREQLFYPEIVSIGPYHHGKSEFATMERVKAEFQGELLRDETQVKSCISMLRSLEERARRCYFHSVNLGSEEFVHMLLRDCCFIIQFLSTIETRNSTNTFCGTKWIQHMIIHDLLLLENQIPFFVLQTLYDHFCRLGNSGLSIQRPDIFDLIRKLFLGTSASGRRLTSDGRCLPPVARLHTDLERTLNYHHLVDIYHQCICHPKKPTTIKSPVSLSYRLIRFLNPLKLISTIFSFIFFGFQEHFDRTPSYVPRSIPSATRLHAAGVAFRKKSMSSTGSIFDLTFSWVDGVLEIPPITLSDDMNCLLANLVAFEQCTGNREQVVSSYAIFMDHLVDTPEDAELLVRRGIVERMMPSNEAVARFFNQLSNSCRLNDYDGHRFVKEFMDINKYSRIFWHAWRAKLVGDYFSNPWSVISLLAAILLLTLTLIQTIFSVLSYIKD